MRKMMGLHQCEHVDPARSLSAYVAGAKILVERWDPRTHWSPTTPFELASRLWTPACHSPQREEVNAMLRVSYSDTPSEQRWSLCGALTGPWVDELRSSWRQARERAPRAHAVIDLRDVIFIDEAGEELLQHMQWAGAELIAAGVENKHLIANLTEKNGKRTLRRRVEDLKRFCDGLGTTLDTAKGGEKQ
jgi:hypothetical protein